MNSFVCFLFDPAEMVFLSKPKAAAEPVFWDTLINAALHVWGRYRKLITWF
jgi:hypothetical protein